MTERPPLAPCWRSLAKDGARRAEVRTIERDGIIDRNISWGEWETMLYASEECALVTTPSPQEDR